MEAEIMDLLLIACLTYVVLQVILSMYVRRRGNACGVVIEISHS